jgi:hypothetical protein
MNKPLYFLLIVLVCNTAMSAEYHVAMSGSDQNDGSAADPFRSINHAAQIARPGDVITVQAGIYRERINPARGGESDSRRIVYQAAPGAKVEIKGSEIARGWKKEKSGIWKLVLPNSFFGDYNPYLDSIHGDWFDDRGRLHHTGEVFLNGKSLYEKENLEKVVNPVADSTLPDPEGSRYTWYCETDEDNTTIWANFQRFNPNKELVEISARPTCFYPERPGLNYITIRGFHFSQAATQWGAPTAEQVGMIATHWNKGWIIEHNVISDSKCSGITLGKERGSGHNVWTADRENVNRDGNIHYIEVLFNVLRKGWSRENIGSHIVRHNTIYNCEQTGICGSMGGAFSLIENNHIYNIWTKRQFSGAEIGGIKLHAAIDTQIRKNRIHDCGRGVWLDWMSQGTRASQNLMYNNYSEDIFSEVNHGPTVVDNNILLSTVGIFTMSQGGAFAHNLIAGQIHVRPELNRFTPYHLPHSTEIKAFATIAGGDDRFYNNIFLGRGPALKPDQKAYQYGLAGYREAAYPVWINGNAYFGASLPYPAETDYLHRPGVHPVSSLYEENGAVYLQIELPSGLNGLKTSALPAGALEKAKIPKAAFEHPDGTLWPSTSTISARRGRRQIQV